MRVAFHVAVLTVLVGCRIAAAQVQSAQSSRRRTPPGSRERWRNQGTSTTRKQKRSGPISVTGKNRPLVRTVVDATNEVMALRRPHRPRRGSCRTIRRS